MGANKSDRYEARLRAVGLGEEDLVAWWATGLPEKAFDDWLTDRVARRPRGLRARQIYGAENVHDFARRAILEALTLGPVDHLLEIGCGGGILLRDSLAIGARTTGLDHSDEMVELARETAPDAGLVVGKAESLPFGEDEFTAVAMSIVFFFLDEPIRVLHECRRVMRDGGALAVYTSAPEMRGTPAAPEPIASRGHFYRDEELAALARTSGMRSASVQRDGGAQLLIARA